MNLTPLILFWYYSSSSLHRSVFLFLFTSQTFLLNWFSINRITVAAMEDHLITTWSQPITTWWTTITNDTNFTRFKFRETTKHSGTKLKNHRKTSCFCFHLRIYVIFVFKFTKKILKHPFRKRNRVFQKQKLFVSFREIQNFKNFKKNVYHTRRTNLFK